MVRSTLINKVHGVKERCRAVITRFVLKHYMILQVWLQVIILLSLQTDYLFYNDILHRNFTHNYWIYTANFKNMLIIEWKFQENINVIDIGIYYTKLIQTMTQKIGHVFILLRIDDMTEKEKCVRIHFYWQLLA